MVQFFEHVDYKKVLEEGPWFWGREIIFITQSMEFDPRSMSITWIPVWVCLPNFPLHFCHTSVMEDNGNTLENYKKIHFERSIA
jgi:hypothetical protein